MASGVVVWRPIETGGISVRGRKLAPDPQSSALELGTIESRCEAPTTGAVETCICAPSLVEAEEFVRAHSQLAAFSYSLSSALWQRCSSLLTALEVLEDEASFLEVLEGWSEPPDL